MGITISSLRAERLVRQGIILVSRTAEIILSLHQALAIQQASICQAEAFFKFLYITMWNWYLVCLIQNTCYHKPMVGSYIYLVIAHAEQGIYLIGYLLLIDIDVFQSSQLLLLAHLIDISKHQDQVASRYAAIQFFCLHHFHITVFCLKMRITFLRQILHAVTTE